MIVVVTPPRCFSFFNACSAPAKSPMNVDAMRRRITARAVKIFSRFVSRLAGCRRAEKNVSLDRARSVSKSGAVSVHEL